MGRLLKTCYLLLTYSSTVVVKYFSTKPWLDPVLPDTLEPVHYDLFQNPNFYEGGSNFTGRVSILVNVLKWTDTFMVHVKALNITKTEVLDQFGNRMEIKYSFTYEPNEYLVIRTKQWLASRSKATIQLEFTGSLSSDKVGFLKSYYVNDVTKKTSWLTMTKFHPNGARKAFPNFDEPRFKATFKITIRHLANFTALTNMPQQSVARIDDFWRETTFATSPPMTSYLVCFIVCDFSYRNNTLAGGQQLRVWSRPDRLHQMNHLLSAARTIQDFYSQHFNIPYSLPKLDLIVVPGYPSVATENWGLIALRESPLTDREQTRASDRQTTPVVISHELAHNYFGNLVTCRSWDELWLNEGFASFYEVKGLARLDPLQLFSRRLFIRKIQSALSVDGSENTSPIVNRLNHNRNELNEAFEFISYRKGAAILNMMESFLGAETFQRGAKRFLRNNAYGTVVTDDLWTAFQQETDSGLDIREIMSPWIYSVGYPVIGIEIQEGRIRATQKRFLSNPLSDHNYPHSEHGYQWHVPLNYRTRRGLTGLVWLHKTETYLEIPISDQEWIKVNYDHSGFFRVNYDPKLWEAIVHQLNYNFTSFSEVERSNLLDDAFNLAKAELLSYNVALGLTEYSRADRSPLVWDSILTNIQYIRRMVAKTQHHRLFQKYILELTSDLMNRLRVVDEGSYSDRLLRPTIITLSCYGRHMGCRQNVTAMLKAWLQDERAHSVPPDLRREVYSIGLASSNLKDEWEIVWKRYKTASNGQEKDNLLFALTRTTDTGLIERLLEYAMDETQIRSEDFFTAIEYLSANFNATDVLWDFVKFNYDAIVLRFELNQRSLNLIRMIRGLVNNFNTEDQLREVLSFFVFHSDGGIGPELREEAVLIISNNIRWMETSFPAVVTWLNQRTST